MGAGAHGGDRARQPRQGVHRFGFDRRLSSAARISAEWTGRQLTVENFDYLQRLPRGPLPVEGFGPGFDLSHGSPLDEDEYLITPADVAPLRAYLETRLTFFGHTHVQGGFCCREAGRRGLRRQTRWSLEADHFYLINPGSVGQPRDEDPRAAYVIYTPKIGPSNTDEWCTTWNRRRAKFWTRVCRER
jgi:diadenosine tetraphosphatase ApaH/serine/threonine PP2A family protein phosphatase